MGSFSWIRTDYNIEVLNEKANIIYGDKIKLLIPQEFGGGFIEGTYEDFGIIYDYDGKEYDIYELVAIWNSKEIQQELIKIGFKNVKTIDNLTKHIRKFGIKIACYDSNQATLKYPIKLIGYLEQFNYEDLETFSVNDPEQGFFSWKWNQNEIYLNYPLYLEKLKSKDKIISDRKIKLELEKVLSEINKPF